MGYCPAVALRVSSKPDGGKSMSDATILEALRLGGIVLTCAAAIWGLATKTTFEDAGGNKRLTPAGQVSVLFMITGALIAMAAFGFESSIRKADAVAAKAKKAREDEQARQDRQRETAARQAEQDRRDRKADAAQATRDLKEQLRADRQMLLINTRAQQASALQFQIQQRQRVERLEESQHQTERLTREISRSILSLDDMTVRFALVSHLNDMPESAYETKIRNAITGKSLPAGAARFGFVRTLGDVRFPTSSSLNPKIDKADAAFGSFLSPKIVMFFYHEDREAKMLEAASVVGKTWVLYGASPRLIGVYSGPIKIEYRDWTDAGPVSSVYDLLGGELSFMIASTDFAWGGFGYPTDDKLVTLNNLNRLSSLPAILLDIPRVGKMCFSGEQMTRSWNDGLFPMFTVKFPKTMDETRRSLHPLRNFECSFLVDRRD
jgi:hypothetical protein